MLGSIRPGRCNLSNDLIRVTQVTPFVAVTRDRAVRWQSPKRLQIVGVYGSVHLLS